MRLLSESYREEGLGLIAELEEALLALQDGRESQEQADLACRALQDLRCSGILAGFDAVATFAGEMSTVFDLMRRGRIPVSRRVIHLALAGGDQLRCMIEAIREDPEVARAATEIAAALRRLGQPGKAVERGRRSGLAGGCSAPASRPVCPRHESPFSEALPLPLE